MSALPFTPEQFRHIAESIERLECDLLTAGQLRRLRKFLRKVFRGSVFADYRPDGTPIPADSYKLSAPDGTMVYRTRYLAELLDTSRRTIQRWISWGVTAGVIEVTTGCDHTGSKRSILTFVFSALVGCDKPYREGTTPQQEAKTPDHRATVPKQNATTPKQNVSVTPCPPIGTRANQLFNNPTTTTIALWSRSEMIRMESVLAASGIKKPRRCVEGAQHRGYSPADVVQLCKQSIPSRDLALHLLEGTALPKPRTAVRREKSHEQIREDIVWRLRRDGVTDLVELESAVQVAIRRLEVTS